MAKELPYFQFEPAEYLTKDVSFCSLAAQGLFINLCAYYWQRECSLTKDQILRRLNYPKESNELITEGVIDLEGENIIIKFLDVQYDNATTKSRINSENGAKGGRPKKPKRNPKETETKPNQKQIESESKGIREEKIKEDNIIEEEIIKPKENNLVFPFTSENFIYQWQIWRQYKKEQHKFTYKSEATEQAALTQLQKMATNRELKAIEIIHHTMANGWKGFVEPKTDPRKETQEAFQAVKEKINFDFSDGKLSFER
jgi:hypothetical protein